MSGVDVLVVAGEPPWPPVNGGRVRTGALASALASAFDVLVAAPPDMTDLDEHVGSIATSFYALPGRVRPSIRHSLSPRPRLGLTQLSPAARTALADLYRATQPRVVVFSMSYLAAVAPVPANARVVTDFANVEHQRLQSLGAVGGARHRASARLETLKARHWEPRVTRACDLAVVVDERDQEQLRAMGAANVVVVPNSAARPDAYRASPSKGNVTFIASGSYGPNIEAGRRLVEAIWPRVRAAVPDAQLRIVGHRSDSTFRWAVTHPGVDVVGSVVDISRELTRSAVIAAPVSSGGGTQLKIIEALAVGRLVVATDYGARSLPPGISDAAFVASDDEAFAALLVKALIDVPERHRREATVWRANLPDWWTATAPLRSAVEAFCREEALA